MTRMCFTPNVLQGALPAIPSKSAAHRILIAAALADRATDVALRGVLSEDIQATIRCLQSMGTAIRHDGDILRVASGDFPKGETVFDCGESGSTLRFLLPVVAARLVGRATFVGRGRLPSRPLSDLCRSLRDNGCELSADALPLTLAGQLEGGTFTLPGNVSSQYVTGLLLALPLTSRGGRITLTTPLESVDYITMTLDILKCFHIEVEKATDGWFVPGDQSYHTPGTIAVEGDWSNAAALLCGGALKGEVVVTGLNPMSSQGDRRILDYLRQFGAELQETADGVAVRACPLHGQRLCLDQNPDLFPVLAVVAAAAQGQTHFTGLRRLRMKECDRLAGIAEMLRAVGAMVVEGEDSLTVEGGGFLHGASLNVCNDHRLVMAAALLALVTGSEIPINGLEAVNKSYPGFVKDWTELQRSAT